MTLAILQVTNGAVVDASGTNYVVAAAGGELLATYAQQAIAAGQTAEEVLDAILAAGLSEGVFASLAAGESGTTDGQYFWVGDAGTVVLYRNDAGVGTEIAELATAASLAGKVGTAALASSTGGEMVGIYGQDGGATTLAAEVARLQSAVPDPRRFGVVGNGVTDDTSAWEDWIAYCAANKIPFTCAPRLTSKITDTLNFPRVTITTGATLRCLPIDLRNAEFVYDGTRDRPAIDIGDAPGANGYYPETDIFLPRVTAAGALQWPGTLGTGDIGVRVRQAFRCRITENYVYGFTNGIVYSGCAYNSMFGKHISDCKFGLVCTTEGAGLDYSFFNENVRIGGKIGNTSTAIPLGNAYLVVFTWDKISSYRGHNSNRFIAPCLESNGAATYQMPIWFDGVGGINKFEHVRVEGAKGPTGLFDGGGGAYACGTEINLDYISYAGQEISLVQVNGACGNILTGAGCGESEWNSGDMSKLVTSGGAAGAAYIAGREFFVLNGGVPTLADLKKLEAAYTTAIKANRRGVQVDAGGYARIGVAIDTRRIKDFICSYQTVGAFVGRPCFLALDAQGNLLTGNATETFQNPITGVAYANETYVKACAATGDAGQLLAAANNGFVTGADIEYARQLRVTVRPEVKTLLFTILGGSGPAVVQSMGVRGFATYNVRGESYPNSSGRGALRVFSPLDDDGSVKLATAKPDTAGTLGYYTRGACVLNNAAASGQPMGWQCSSAGWLAPAWVAGATYAVPGMLVTNDTGKVYELTTAGVAAGSGGPTDTTATWDGITDGTCKWRYIGTLATFVAMANAA